MSATESAVDAISALRSRTREVRSIQDRTGHLVGAGKTASNVSVLSGGSVSG